MTTATTAATTAVTTTTMTTTTRTMTTMTDPRTTRREGVHLVRLVESPVDTSAIDRRHDYVPAPKPRAIVMRPTTDTQFVVTSAIDLRDDVLRDQVPGIVGDVCFGALTPAHDAIVQAIEQDDTRPIRRLATGTTPPELATNRIRRGAASELRDAALRRDVAAVLRALDTAAHDRGVGAGATHDDAGAHEQAGTHDDGSLDHRAEIAGDDPLAMTFARGSSPSLDGAIAFARPSITHDGSSLDTPAPCGHEPPRMTMSRDGGSR
ncbi:MAG: hypothetical protein ACKV2T_17780 [Kofleriaceae bacterium]